MEDLGGIVSAEGRWVVDPSSTGLSSLQYQHSPPLEDADLGPEDVLVDIYAASLNYRDIFVVKVRFNRCRSFLDWELLTHVRQKGLAISQSHRSLSLGLTGQVLF
jgi:NADPH:quinone reductase-like Zn-dependent oxidoreductase